MKIFGRTGGYYLFWASAVYLISCIICPIYFKQVPLEVLQVIWISTLALPFTYPPLGRYFNLDINWDKNMFGWRKKQIAEQVAKDNPPLEDIIDAGTEETVTAPVEDKFDASEATYTVGKNNAGNTQLRMKLEHGSASLTMAPDAVADLIEQLAVNIRKQYKIEITQLEVPDTSNQVD